MLMSAKNDQTKLIVKADIDILVLQRSDPTLVVGKEPVMVDPRTGEPRSFREVTAKEMKEKREHERDGYVLRHTAIEILLNKEV